MLKSQSTNSAASGKSVTPQSDMSVTAWCLTLSRSEHDGDEWPPGIIGLIISPPLIQQLHAVPQERDARLKTTAGLQQEACDESEADELAQVSQAAYAIEQLVQLFFVHSLGVLPSAQRCQLSDKHRVKNHSKNRQNHRCLLDSSFNLSSRFPIHRGSSSKPVLTDA